MFRFYLMVDFCFNKNGYKIFIDRISSYSRMKNATFYITTFGESDQSEFSQFDFVADNRNIDVRVFRFIRLHIVVFRFETWGFVLFLKEPRKGISKISK